MPARIADDPMTLEQVDKCIDRHRAEIKLAERQIAALDAALRSSKSQPCRCNGGLVIPRSKSGLWDAKGAYRAHTLDCPLQR